MTFEESVTGCHCLDVTACAERFSVSGKQKRIYIIVVTDIFQRFCPETDHLLHRPRKKEFTLEGNPQNSASFRRNR